MAQPMPSAPGPSATTSPAHSCPGMKGRALGQRPMYSPLMMCGSVPQMPMARTRQRTSMGPGLGVSTVCISSRFGATMTTARMVGGTPVPLCCMVLSPLPSSDELGQPAVHHEGVAGHVRHPVAGQQDDGIGHLFRFPPTPQINVVYLAMVADEGLPVHALRRPHPFRPLLPALRADD